MQTLLETLQAAGKPVEVVHMPEGSTVVLLPHGGRVLGLYAAGSEKNFYWTHPALESPQTARAFYDGNDWHNSGGDRTWLAPEVDVFFPRYPDEDTRGLPSQITFQGQKKKLIEAKRSNGAGLEAALRVTEY